MTAPARVGDVIAHGETIPANVVRLRDSDNDTWTRCDGTFTYVGGGATFELIDYWPMTVVEVDPEPQPAESGPLVLTLPEVPSEAVALKGNRTGWRWSPYGIGWENGLGVSDPDWTEGTLAEVLAIERPDGVTVELAPPRMPRTWQRVEHVIGAGSFPGVVEISKPDWPTERWTLVTDDGLYTGLRGGRWTLVELRTLGDVTEVLDA